MTVLYDAVAAGMWAYAHSAFRVTTLGPRRIRLEPGTLIVSTHRRETDVPLIGPPLYLRAELWRRRSARERMSFAARDDMFLPGFFAGFPGGLSSSVRRVLFPVSAGRWLPRVQVYPLRSASVARLGEVLRERTADALTDLIPAEELERFEARARACGLPPPFRADDVLRGEYADLLWRPVSRRHPAGSGLDGFWSRRAARAAADFRALVDVVSEGGILLVFPEGRPSSDGRIGPVERGIAALVRRAQPSRLQPVAPAYDPLTRGRTRAFVSLGEPSAPPSNAIEDTVLRLLRRTTPLTCGQVVAARVSEAGRGEASGRVLAEAVEAALSEGRNVEPDLLEPRGRRRRLEDALAALPARRQTAAYLAREYGSARAD